MIKEKINFEKLWLSAKNEAEWLRYYGHKDTRISETYENAGFYDRIVSIGYTKRVIPLNLRCAMVHISSDNPVIESEVCDIYVVGDGRNHDKNIYTPLEYFLSKNIGREQLINIIKG